MGKLYFVRREA
uniref:Induced stolon tip protein PJ-2 n=3 Tax=Pentapetalae TaxID=1437201 RepID=Q6RJX9_CAPAN|nr:induced stolon tip protein PJ-2 [Capsicum annuum]